METGVGLLDVFAFIVFAVLIFVGVIIVVGLGKLPGQLAHKWSHPQASAINAMSWIGIATGGLLWPIAFIWAFTTPVGVKLAIKDDHQANSSQANSLPANGMSESNAAAASAIALRNHPGDKEMSS